MINYLSAQTKTYGSAHSQNELNTSFQNRLNEVIGLTKNYKITDSGTRSIETDKLFFGSGSDQIKYDGNGIYYVERSAPNTHYNLIQFFASTSNQYLNLIERLKVNSADDSITLSPGPQMTANTPVYLVFSDGNIMGPKLFRFAFDGDGISLEQDLYGNFVSPRTLFRFNGANQDLNIDDMDIFTFARNISSGAIGREVGSSGGTQVIYEDFNPGVGTSGHDFLTRHFYDTDGNYSILARADKTNTSSAANYVLKTKGSYLAAPSGMGIPVQSSAPSDNPESGDVILYQDSTSKELRMLASDGTVYKADGTTV